MHRPWIPVSYGDRPDVEACARQLRRVMTRAERVLWERLRGNKIAGLRFRRQHALEGYIADFFCHHARLIVEVDGETHADQLEYDRERDEHFARLGYLVLRYTNEQVFKRAVEVVAEITRIAAGRSDQRRAPPPPPRR
ncbi:MAG: DUF559 domain-containing protein [Myxococcales bacterium]